MLKSMTGFGRGEFRTETKQVAVEIKTVNHRYVDVSIRMPRDIMSLEDRIRDCIQKSIGRGKVDVFVSFLDFSASHRQVKFDEVLIGSYLEALNSAITTYNIKNDISASLISKLPDVFSIVKGDLDQDEAWNSVNEALVQALEKLIIMREREGLALTNTLFAILETVEQYFTNIIARAPSVSAEYKERLEGRLKDIIGIENVDAQRLATEVAIFTDKCSIDEEIARFTSHIKQFKTILNCDESAGRKLDFLIQELNREINTIGSKANDLEVTNNVISLKCEIEKLREQIQNLE